jgi:hypothetical protein
MDNKIAAMEGKIVTMEDRFAKTMERILGDALDNKLVEVSSRPFRHDLTGVLASVSSF